jgi:chromosomal replication initiator protein
MNDIRQNIVDLNRALSMKGVDIRKHESIIKQLELSSINGKVQINFPHKYLYEIYNAHLKNIIEEHFEDEIIYTINNQQNINNNQIKNNIHFKNKFSFERFIPGNKNKLILDICKEITSNISIKYNPLIIYGRSSSGKTHLANSIINSSNKNKKIIKDLFVINQDLENKNIIDVYKDIINNEIAAIENIHHSDNKDSSILLEKLIDHFYENNKQLILTCNWKKMPFSEFPDSLNSRIKSALILEIKDPDLSVKINYAKRFCRENKIFISGENIFTISSNCNSIRSIKGMLLKLTTLPEVDGPVSPEQVNRMFKEKLKRNINFKHIVKIVSKTTGYSEEDLLSMNRGKEISLARQVCMYLCRSKLNWSYPRIGMKFGQRDHSSVIYNIKKIKRLKSVNQDINKMLSQLLHKIEST